MAADEKMIHKIHQYLIDEKILVATPPPAPSNITPINSDTLS
jgi:hypothetical protein